MLSTAVNYVASYSENYTIAQYELQQWRIQVGADRAPFDQK